jgi:hypothetical protein
MEINMNPTIGDIKKINNRIMSHAENSAWDQVKLLTLERQNLIVDYFKDSTFSESEALTIQSLIENCDKSIHIYITTYKNKNIQSSLNLKKSYNAVQEYKTTHNATTHS